MKKSQQVGRKNYSKQLVPKHHRFKFNKYQLLGPPDAETDNQLDHVFIDTGAYNVLEDVQNPKSIVVGRTGSGKSALIKRLLDNSHNITRIVPESMSLKYLSNSTILEYFRGLGIKLNFFYKVLWKHVFIVEILKLYLGETDQKKQSLLQSLWSKVTTGGKSDPAKKAALEYFDQWSDEFWLNTEHRIKELEVNLEKKFIADTGIDAKVAIGRTSVSSVLGERSTIEVKNKAEKIISEIQAENLVTLIRLLSDNVFNNYQKRYYIVIDDLDKEWVSPQIVYDLIGAMIEVVKEFQEKFKGVKIIISLRENLHQIIFSGKEHRGGQREKYTPLFLNLAWDEHSLKAVINSRLQFISKNQVNLSNVFEWQGKSKISGLDYTIERTYLRPRDIISFFNKIIEHSSNRSQFTTNLIKLAEPSYSIERLQALEDEWGENFGDISKCYVFLVGIHNGFSIYNVKEERFSDLLFSSEHLASLKGELRQIATAWINSNLKPLDFRTFLSHLLFIFYRIGIIGIKRRPQYKVEFFYNSDVLIRVADFDNNDARFYVHKALYSALKINVKEQEIDYLD